MDARLDRLAASRRLARVDVELFAGVAVSDLPRAVEWFDRFFGDAESFDPDDTERVWTVSDHRYLYAVLDPDDAGHAHVTLFVADFDRFVTDVAQRGLHPDSRETYDNGVRKAIYRDPDGNEIGVGGGPAG
jgi:catechol 2,3-dioxygenase-like lactoylglutathione lyase family enzyme